VPTEPAVEDHVGTRTERRLRHTRWGDPMLALLDRPLCASTRREAFGDFRSDDPRATPMFAREPNYFPTIDGGP
jgi:hypothetical protein